MLKLKIVFLCMVLMVMVSCVSAFPLTGGNGKVSASVLGTMTEGDRIGIDIVGNIVPGDVTLVDSEDKFYEGGDREGITSIANYVPGRNIFFVNVPDKVEIKRIRITPLEGDPFSIEWTGVPEVNDSIIGMKFYGLQTAERSRHIKSWTVDIKITNSGSQKQTIEGSQIEVVDQFGYPYNGVFKILDLMPGEAARFNIKVEAVSDLSRPVYLKYLPSNLTMDISAWA